MISPHFEEEEGSSRSLPAHHRLSGAFLFPHALHTHNYTNYTGDPGQEEERRERLKPGPFAAMSTK